MISLAEVVSFASPKMTRNLCATLPNAYCKPKDVPPKRVDGITRMKRSGAPKQAFSAYVWYGSGMRVKIKEESPHMLQKDIMKELRSRWKAMSDTDRAPYEEKAAADKIRYEDEMAVYTKSLCTEKPTRLVQKLVKENTKKKKDVSSPKHARLAKNYFGSAMRMVIRSEIPDISGSDMLKEIGDRWKAMSEADKAPYQSLAAADKIRYKDEMKVYEESQVAEGKKMEKRAPKRTLSAYNFFASAVFSVILTENPSLSAAEVMREQGVRWKAMSEADKAPYQSLAAADKIRYKDEMKVYEESQMAEEKKVEKSAPKKALCAYNFFVSELFSVVKAEIPEITASGIYKELGVRWKSMSEADKAPYQSKAAEDKIRHKNEMAEFEGKGSTSESK